ncbi:MAG: hypothetical protein KatS3mg042_0388 [Rhodothermaceae bacterium]|nr:MAG: hypothetical protein KatS3mg042_0388 [Rhodothermaceae bacterium]
MAPGTYWVGVRVVSENEFFVASGTLTIDPAPSGSCDLDISLMMLNPNPVAEDQDLTITVGTTNNGTANCTSEDIEYYLSTNATLTTSDILVGTDVETATLAPGESDSEDITFKPQDLGVAPGTYWVGVRVVSENEFFVASGTLTIDPAPSGSCDLDISLMMLNPNPVAEDQDLTITVGTTNNGTANCTSEDIEYYLSTNATLTTSDILVGTDVETATLAPGESDSEDITFKPQDLGVAPGTYWVGVRVVSENEFFVASGTLTIDPAPSGSCDLDISLMMLNPNPVAEDQDLTITVGTTNNGTANCTSEDIEYYLSTNATLTTSDILVGTDVETATLAPGESDSEDITFKPQDLGVAPGTYWVGVRVVSENEFFVASGTLTIDPAVGNGALVGVALPSLSCGIDDDLTVPVMINDDVTGLSIIAYDFVLSFDPSIIDLSNVSTAGTLSNGWTLSSNTTSGQISVSAASSTELSGSGDLIFLTGKCLSEGTSPLTWISFTFNEGSPSASLTDGSVNVSSCPTCGDVSGNGTVSAFDASLILQYNVGILPPEQDFFSCAADVSGNGTISSFDAAQILQYNVGIISDLSCTGSASKTPFEQLWGSLEYGSPGFDHSSGRAFLPIHINPALDNLVSLEGFLYLGGAGSSILNIRKNGLPDGWMVSHSTRNDTLYFSMAGSTPLTDDSFFEVVFSDDNLSLKEPVSLSIRANEYGPVLLDHANLSTMIPSTFKLFQNYPNPFNPTTSISFLLPEPTQVTLEVFDLLGRRVHALIRDEEMPAGKHSVVFRGDELSSGIYIYRITAGNYREQRMFILQK